MGQYGNHTLFSMGAEVSSYKPNARKTQIYKDLNARIRRVIDMRPAWSSLISRTVLNIPTAYTTGSVTLVAGSDAIVGVATAWPIDDVVNTTVPAGLRVIGYQDVTPSSMTGINVGDYLYISDFAYSETVAVTDVTNSTFTAQFQYQHNAGFTLTKSSLAGLQLQLDAYSPIYTLKSVATATTGFIDMAFGGPSTTESAYTLLKAYVTIDPNMKDFLSTWDPTQGIPLFVHEGQDFLAQADPQRTTTGNPQGFVDLGPNAAGLFEREFWPYQKSAYSIPIVFIKQWPELKRPTDKPPWFINPTVFINGAIADALRRKDLRDIDDKDPYYDPNAAKQFDELFMIGALDAAYADEGLYQQALTRLSPGEVGGANSAYWQSHVGYDWNSY